MARLTRLSQRGPHPAESVVVIGLGRFGRSLALELMSAGTDVLGIDSDPQIVQSLNGRLTHVVRADSTDEDALRQLEVDQYDRAVVGIGTDIESSILTASLLRSFDITSIWAKAITEAHGRILAQLGVLHVVHPEDEMGRRVAHVLRRRMLDFMPFDDDFPMVRTAPPRAGLDRPLRDLHVRSRHDVTVMAVHRPGDGFSYATADTVVRAGDTILVSGPTASVERFSPLP